MSLAKAGFQFGLCLVSAIEDRRKRETMPPPMPQKRHFFNMSWPQHADLESQIAVKPAQGQGQSQHSVTSTSHYLSQDALTAGQ